MSLAQELVKNIQNGEFPESNPVWTNYGFDLCKDEKDFSYLFGLYKELFSFRIFKSVDLEKFQKKGKLKLYIKTLFEECSPNNFYYQWFKIKSLSK